MLPDKSPFCPAAVRTSPIMVVVVVLPFEPVIPTMGASEIK